MAFFKVTFVFNAEKAGWSESFYQQAGDINSVLPMAKALAEVRAVCLGFGAAIEAIRISDDNIRGDALFHSGVFKGSIAAKTSTNVRDTPWQSYLLRVQAGQLYRRMFHLRGIPDEWVAFDKTTLTYAPTSEAVKCMGDLKAQLVKDQWRLKAINRDTNVNPVRVINNLTRNNAGFMEVDVGNQNPVAVGDSVVLLHLKGLFLDGVKHRGIVTARVSGVHTLNISIPGNFVWQPPAQLRPVQYTYESITNVQTIRPGKRNTGRAFFVPLGRRSQAKTAR